LVEGRWSSAIIAIAVAALTVVVYIAADKPTTRWAIITQPEDELDPRDLRFDREGRGTEELGDEDPEEEGPA
jgi:hypothetical protein